MLRPPAVHPLVAALLRSFVCFALRRERARFLAGDGARFILVFLPIPSRQKRCWRVAASWGRGAARAHTTRERDQLPGFGWVLAQQEQRGQRELFFWRSKSNLKRAFRFGSACTSRSDRASSRSRSRPGGGLAGRETPHRQGCSQQAHRTPPACAESSDIARTFAPRGHAGGPPPPPRQLCLFRYLAYRTAFHMSPSRSTWSTRLLECQLATAHPGPGS